MKTVTVYLDESLSVRDMVKLKHEIMALPHVMDVEHPRQDKHDLTIDYEAHTEMPTMLLRELRSRGFHPDIVSA